MKVYQAIAQVAAEMAQVGISKDRRNVSQNFNFRGIDDVYNALGKVLARAGLVILPRVLAREVSERETAGGKILFYVCLDVEYDLVAAEDGSKHTIKTVGEAMDSGDKATAKALSAAYKGACLQAFCIPTEGNDDPDEDTHDDLKPRNDPEAEEILAALTKAANGGLDALQAKFKEIANSPKKTAVWTKHQAELKKAASDVSMFGGDPLTSFPVLKKVPV